MTSFTLWCCVIALPILVIGYKQDFGVEEKSIITQNDKSRILRSERGWIGCLYNPNVCEEDERCLDDNLFGVCRSENPDNESPVFYDYKDLSKGWKRLLRKELTKLALGRHRWTDVYTQCILRSILLSYRSDSLQDATLCRLTSGSKDNFASDQEFADDANPRGLLGNEVTADNNLAEVLAKAEEEKRDAAVKLHKYFDKEANLMPSEDYDDELSNGDDLANLREQLMQLKSFRDEIQASLDSDGVEDLKKGKFNKLKEKPRNDDLEILAALMKQKDNRPKRRSEVMGQAQTRSTAQNMSPEEALSELRPSKRFPEHQDESEAAQARALDKVEEEEAAEAMLTTIPPRKIDSRWAFVQLAWPKNGPQGFQSSKEVEEFLTAIQEQIGVDRLFDDFVYKDSEVNFHLAASLLKNPEAVVQVIEKNVTQPIPGGPIVINSGLGKNSKVSTAKLATAPKHFGVTFAVCGGVLFIIIAVIIVFFMQRYRLSKGKLDSLTKAAEQGESKEAYQDLCRHRMQSRNSEKAEPVSTAARAVGAGLSRGDSNSAGSARSSTSSWSEEPIHSNMDISTGHLILSYMEEHLNNKEKLESEWNNLCAYQPDVVKCDVGKREENLNRNRYLDNIPYDNNRVELKTAVDGSNYFNASYVINHDPKNPQYIVTQGPLSNTVAQFWQMIWEQGSIVIVNLTRLIEDGISLCQKYWPEEGSELYNNYEVHLVSEHVWCEDYLVRSFYLKNVSSGETRTVTQFHFLSWPDLGEPGTVKTLLDFRRKVNKSYKGRSCPVIVHCSDGCGRSGTYILLDMILNRLAKGVKEIDISAAVEHLRDQRCQMVKTKGQFEFVLTAIAEEVHAMLKSLPQ